VNTATGKATPVLRVPVGEFECYSLTYHAPTGRFLTVSVRSSTLGIFDPQLETFTKVAILGLPAGQEKISGIAYQQNKDRILISFGPSGTNHENRIAQIDLQGRVLKISADLRLGDRDFLSWHPQSGDLFAIDFNGSSPRIATVVEPFGKLSTIRFGNPPRDSQLTDLAVISQQGRMFTIRQNTGELVEVIDGGKRFSTIGRFQTKADVVGIAAAPHDWPAPLLAKRPRTSSLKPAADSLKEPVFESVLGVYGQAIRGQRFPFVNLRPPNRNLWTKEIENKLRGTLSYGQVDYSGTAKLVIPATGTYTIDLPARGTQLRFNGILLKPGDVQLQKGVYDVEIYTNHWGQPYLKYAHANVYKQGTRTKIPFVNTAAAIEEFRSQKIDSRKVIEVCDYDLKQVRVVGREPGSMLQFAGSGYLLILKLRYDGSHPITLEAIVQAPYRGTIVGSFDGSGLGLDVSNGHFFFHVNDGRPGNSGYATIKSSVRTSGDKPVHIAGVFDGQKLSLYVDGKLQGTDEIARHKVSKQPFMVGADPDSRGSPQQFLNGIIDEVHISRIARYQKNFTPPGQHKPDKQTLVLYRFNEGEGDVAHDASDNALHGKIHWAKWVH
jgi:hypothetical protein